MTSVGLRAAAAAAAVSALFGPAALAQGAPTLAVPAERSAPVEFHIPGGPLDQALAAYAVQSHIQLLYEHALVQDLRTVAIVGRLTPEEALGRLLGGAPIQVLRTGPGVIVLKRLPAAPPSAETGLPTPPSEVGTVVVTGTLIRGAPPSSPVTTLSRDAMDRAGQATVADALQALPQAFGGVSTPQTALLGTDGLGTNAAVSTGVDLRGLGANSTLVLVNGRRMAGSGLEGDFADVSAVPTAAVDRVEVLLDGASALYGSDAVGGVINIILRRNFTGAETRLRYGDSTEGGASDLLVGQTFGQAWSDGHALISLEHQDQGRLKSSERAPTADSDLTSLGGTDHRVIYSHPGNILGFDPVSGAFVSAYAIPAGQDGTALAADDFTPGSSNLENTRALADTLPSQSRDSLYLNLAQAVSPALELSLDARYSRRTFRFDLPENLSVFSVDGGNPFYVAPDGASSEYIGYAFGDETGAIHSKGEVQNFGVSAGGTLQLPHGWALDVYGDLAQDQERTTSYNLVNSSYLNEALGAAPDDPSTVYVAARDGYFNPFGDKSANSAATLAFISSGVSLTHTLSRVESFNAKADGPVLALPGGEVKLALGVQVRRETFLPSTYALTDGSTPYTDGGTTFRRTVTAGFAEFSVPLIGPANALTGVRRLELSLAGRIESYSDVGVSGTPKLGVLWTPLEGVALRASYGRSFRAPALSQVDAPQVVAPTFATRGAEQILSLVRYGGNAGLAPETATTWTTGVDLKPRWAQGLTGSLGWFDIDYRDRIGQPVLEDFDNALTDPAYARFVTFVDPVNDPAAARTVANLLAQSTSASAALFPASAYGAIIDARYVNAAVFDVQGFDGALTYTRALQLGRLDTGFDATWLTRYDRRLTADAASQSLLGRTGYPARVKLRASGAWDVEGYGALLAVNYVDGSRPDAGARVDPYATLDLQLSWRSAAAATGPLSGVVLALNVRNLLDTSPPFYDGANGIGYDPANADVLGRVISLQLTRRW